MAKEYIIDMDSRRPESKRTWYIGEKQGDEFLYGKIDWKKLIADCLGDDVKSPVTKRKIRF